MRERGRAIVLQGCERWHGGRAHRLVVACEPWHGAPMKRIHWLLLLAMSSVAAAPGCGGESSGGPLPACTSGEDTSAFEPNGFYPDKAPWPTSTITVTAVTPSELDLQAASGKKLVLKWSGPDLTAYFHVGEVVLVDDKGPWQVVSNEDTFAAAIFESQVGPLAEPGPAPFAGPTLALAPPCLDAGTAHFGLVVKLGSKEITVGGHQSGTLGDYQVRNGGVQYYSLTDQDYHDESISVLGPVHPSP